MSVSATVASVLKEDELELAITLPDGSTFGPSDAPATVKVNNERAFATLASAPGELGFVRAYVSGDIDIEGDFYGFLERRDSLRDAVDGQQLLRTVPKLAPLIWQKRAKPDSEVVVRGWSDMRRARSAIKHHYDVPASFFELFLGDSMAYTCAVYESPGDDLDKAQFRKYDLVCQKLALQPTSKLLDVGCGWGGLLLHAARNYDVNCVGITISDVQAEAVRKRIAEEHLQDKIEVRVQDYRELSPDEKFDAISAVGVYEHIGLPGRGKPTFFDHLATLLKPRGRLLNHAISRRSGEKRTLGRRGFVNRYVFPDGSAVEIGETVSAVQSAGLEVHHVESLRAHYGPTLRAWVDNLEANWDQAVEIVGEERARVWRLFMAGYALHMETFGIQHHQTLAVLPDETGDSGMPWRPDWA
jgi:cyclopropane-fatty-acyl-phospholipid synthase